MGAATVRTHFVRFSYAKYMLFEVCNFVTDVRMVGHTVCIVFVRFACTLHTVASFLFNLALIFTIFSYDSCTIPKAHISMISILKLSIYNLDGLNTSYLGSFDCTFGVQSPPPTQLLLIPSKMHK